jgi:PHD/YefM family antitoxin component YafN of YafNO toxin-antitoxin module
MPKRSESLSLKNFPRNAKELTQQIRQTGHPLLLTVNGKAKFVVQEAESYQKMLEMIDRLEAIEGIRRGLQAVEEGRVQPANEAFEEIRRKHKIPRNA